MAFGIIDDWQGLNGRNDSRYLKWVASIFERKEGVGYFRKKIYL